MVVLVEVSLVVTDYTLDSSFLICFDSTGFIMLLFY